MRRVERVRSKSSMSEMSKFLRGDVGLHQSSVKRVSYCSSSAFLAEGYCLERSAVVTLGSAAALYIGRYAYAEPSYKRCVVHWSKGRRLPGATNVVRCAQDWRFCLCFQACRRPNMLFSMQMSVA